VDFLEGEPAGDLSRPSPTGEWCGYGSWVHIDGWSDKVLDYIARFEADAANRTA
jgi:hypothetical protein